MTLKERSPFCEQLDVKIALKRDFNSFLLMDRFPLKRFCFSLVTMGDEDVGLLHREGRGFDL